MANQEIQQQLAHQCAQLGHEICTRSQSECSHVSMCGDRCRLYLMTGTGVIVTHTKKWCQSRMNEVGQQCRHCRRCRRHFGRTDEAIVEFYGRHLTLVLMPDRKTVLSKYGVIRSELGSGFVYRHRHHSR